MIVIVPSPFNEVLSNVLLPLWAIFGGTTSDDWAYSMSEDSFDLEILVPIFYKGEGLGIDASPIMEGFQERDVKDVMYSESRGKSESIRDWANTLEYCERPEPFWHKFGRTRYFEAKVLRAEHNLVAS